MSESGVDKVIDEPLAVLERHFGHRAFLDGQEQVIDQIMSGKDGLVVIGTPESGVGNNGTGVLQYEEDTSIFLQTGGTMNIAGSTGDIQFDNSAGSTSTHTQTGGLTTVKSDAIFRNGDQEVYIKLKVVGEEPFDKAICLSFHPAERPLDYPFR